MTKGNENEYNKETTLYMGELKNFDHNGKR
jgi:hypothetical protein